MGTNLKPCEKLFTSKQANAVTRSAPSSGRSSPMSTVLTLPVPTTVTPTCSWSESTCTTTKPPAASTSRGPSSLTLNQVPWTLSDPAHSARSSDLTTLSSDSPVPVTTGPRVTTQKVPNSSTPSWTSSVRNPKAVTASRASSSPTPSVVVLVPASVHF